MFEHLMTQMAEMSSMMERLQAPVQPLLPPEPLAPPALGVQENSQIPATLADTQQVPPPAAKASPAGKGTGTRKSVRATPYE